MADPQQNTTELLTVEEQDICQKIVAQEAELAGQRAAALLAVNEGLNHAEVAAQTGLTAGQIRYLLTSFRKKRLAVFPDEVLSRTQRQANAAEIKADEAARPAAGEKQSTIAAKKEKKMKNSKKDKKSKAKKSDKKSKKTEGKDKKKKDKKSKKAGKKKSKK